MEALGRRAVRRHHRVPEDVGQDRIRPGEFSTPHVIAMDSRGRLFVGDRNNNRIQILDQDGNFLDLWYQFGRPSPIVITADDRIHTADSESFDFHNPGWEKGIRIGSARDGSVEYFIKDVEPTTISHSGAGGADHGGCDAAGRPPRAMALELDTGGSEPGMNQLEAALYLMLEGEKLGSPEAHRKRPPRGRSV